MIPKNPALSPDQNYAFLRSEGLKYIEELGSRIWTDYNEHDPGITILETLCYALTELGFRSGMSMKDLLTDKNGKISSSQTLYTAKHILTQSPLSVNDYRKLLIDIEGVHNAWFFTDDFYAHNGKTLPAGEVAIYADCDKDSLTYAHTPHPIYLSGLFKVLLDLDTDLQYGDLNNGELQIVSPAIPSLPTGAVSLTVIFPAWNETNPAFLKADVNSITIISKLIVADADGWKITTKLSFTAGANSFTETLIGRIEIDLKPAGRTVTITDVKAFFAPVFTKQVLSLYIDKIKKSKLIVQTAGKKLSENRNLCEDFVSITTIKDEEIAICCDINVKPVADMEEVQAKAFFAIEEYLNPSVRFYLLSELMDKGYTADEVFEGPVLKHGFIDTNELEKTQLRQTIYASDIISLLMDIEGVIAVRNFRMTKYGGDGKPVGGESGKSWCIPITLWHKPLFSETKSKVVFYKNQFPFLAGRAEIKDTLSWLRALNGRNKLTGHIDDLQIPEGTYYSLSEYDSVQYLFPQTYAVGKAGLPSAATDERRGQVKQLKAYLLFYDQLLADFFSQLENAKELFSTDDIVHTYYGQFINNIKEIEPIYKKDSGATHSLLDLLLQNQDSVIAPPTPPNEWEKLYETNETFIDRRNRFLDHLMSRFSESFNDYVLLMYSLDYNTQQQSAIVPSKLISNKIEFLKEYPTISYERGRAFNYCPQNDDFSVNTSELWDTKNVSGVEKKVSRLGGIANYARRFLFCLGNAQIMTTSDTPAKYKFVFKNQSNDTLTSVAAYDAEDDLNSALLFFLTAALAETNYIIEPSGTNWRIAVVNDNGDHLAVSADFADKTSATTAINQFITEFNKECNDEGLHLVEHILLRPRNNTFQFAPVCLDPDCDFCGEQDPYSFRISIVLPYWPLHFKTLAFRNYFEDIVRKEAPAHTTVKVCWVDNTALHDFETAYKAWIIALANYASDPTTVDVLQAANDKLIPLLFNLHSEYPKATLHDCDESKDTNPVMLGKTILGSFKK